MNIGYLVPEFPGQTHAMFWREIAVLRQHGARVDLLSTRRPVATGPHAWVPEATAESTYLLPLRPHIVAAAARAFVRAGPGGCLRWFRALRSAERDGTVKGAVRMASLAVVGAAVAGLAQRRQWRHLHVHSCADAANLAQFAAQLTQLTYSVTLHGPLRDYGGNQRQKWSNASFAFVITEVLRREIETVLGPALPPVIRMAGMGIDAARTVRSTPYQPWEPGTPARIFSCGRLNRAKGHVDSIAAVHALRRAGIDAFLTIAGEDDAGGTGYRQVVERAVRDEGLGAAVRLLGMVSDSEVERWLDQTHVFVLASMAEPLGVAVMEAMAMEVPVVVTSGGGVTELVEDGRNGLVVPPSSPLELAGAVEKLLRDPALGCQLGRNARATVLAGFSCERNATLLLAEIAALHDADAHHGGPSKGH
ncbi:MAG TPA: exopolysaccharide biosynthesis GT4 family glycosyltransferase EpsE [Acidimicrobiales bacterium]|nr:exopolysaccharide biosynthesis GT4 family glycosyltransferase EpsE [Acidimicrobiales bacterium]